MDKKYMVILWNDTKNGGGEPHKIEEFETLKEAVQCLVSNGGLFEHQEIVQKVDWMPGSENKPATIQATAAQIHVMTPEEEALAKRPNPQGPPPEQPVVINAAQDAMPKVSIFEKVLPPQMIHMIQKDD